MSTLQVAYPCLHLHIPACWSAGPKLVTCRAAADPGTTRRPRAESNNVCVQVAVPPPRRLRLTGSGPAGTARATIMMLRVPDSEPGPGPSLKLAGRLGEVGQAWPDCGAVARPA